MTACKFEQLQHAQAWRDESVVFCMKKAAKKGACADEKSKEEEKKRRKNGKNRGR